MEIIKKYSLRFLFTILSISICLLIITTLYHFDIISSNIYQLLKLIILLGNILISGIILSKKANKKGYLEGIKLGLFMIILFTLITLITGQGLKLRLLLYDSIMLITAILGGMIGINKK
jgi:putative membrane protein (TIGR04086 family)